VNYPPSNRDFVSYFLLDSKEGFCSYFASAMAVMARVADLRPATWRAISCPRAGEDGTIVTVENAHAWVEIYFQGVGWIPFNPTPAAATRRPTRRGDR
jgi:transglutaminase-like putative cysteine protease